jgi:hypothetical protein
MTATHRGIHDHTVQQYIVFLWSRCDEMQRVASAHSADMMGIVKLPSLIEHIGKMSIVDGLLEMHAGQRTCCFPSYSDDG